MIKSGEIVQTLNVVFAGNPNCGKTTLFNRLTGERRAVGNYSGVTVDKAEGSFARDGIDFHVVDLPGTYSLNSASHDELVARNFLLEQGADVIVNVVDASNLERNLFLTLQLKELGIPLVIALNMCDLAKSRGRVYDVEKLSRKLDAPIVEVVGLTGAGLDALVSCLSKRASESLKEEFDENLRFSATLEREIEAVQSALERSQDEKITEETRGKSEREKKTRLRWLAIKLLEKDEETTKNWNVSDVKKVVEEACARLESTGTPSSAKIASDRYANVRKICKDAVKEGNSKRVEWSDRADRILTHPVWGLGIFFVAMFVVFWLTFTLGNAPVALLERALDALSGLCDKIWANSPDSLLRSLIVDGVIGGVGGVVVFFPNIFILFAAISILEESGYMARGAFLTDRFLKKFGLSGKSFIPMLVGFGCSVPAVLATRIIEDKKSRLSTIFVVPLMSCGARFPIYVLIIPAFFAAKWQAPILWCVYFAGILVAAILSSVLSETKFRGQTAPMLIELPPYHAPTLRTTGSRALERGWQYLKKAGTTILGVSLVLWALSTFPRLPHERAQVFVDRAEALQREAGDVDLDETLAASRDERRASEAEKIDESTIATAREWERLRAERAEAELEYSIVGRIGKLCEPLTSLAGFDRRIAVALVGAFAAKELFVAQLGIVFKVGGADENSESLRETFARNYSPLVGICAIIFCLIGAPCMATFVVVAKESSFRWALFQWTTLTAVGFALAVLTYQIGSRLF